MSNEEILERMCKATISKRGLEREINALTKLHEKAEKEELHYFDMYAARLSRKKVLPDGFEDKPKDSDAD